jgi:hypothetical protein
MLSACFVLLCLPVFAEEVPEALRPPKGSQVAIVVRGLAMSFVWPVGAAAGAGLEDL